MALSVFPDVPIIKYVDSSPPSMTSITPALNAVFHIHRGLNTPNRLGGDLETSYY